MWTKKCSQCIALLNLDCNKGIRLELSKKQQQKQSVFLLLLMVNQGWKSQRFWWAWKNKEKLLFLYGGRWQFKKPKAFVGWRAFLWSQKLFLAVGNKMVRRWFSLKKTEHVIPKEKEKALRSKTRKVVSSYLDCTLFSVSFNFSITNGLSWHSGQVESSRRWSGRLSVAVGASVL